MKTFDKNFFNLNKFVLFQKKFLSVLKMINAL